MEYVRQGDTSVTVPDGYIQKLVVGALHAALIEDRPTLWSRVLLICSTSSVTGMTVLQR